MLKKILLGVVAVMFLCGVAFAEETTEEASIIQIEVKQGIIKPYDGGKVQHLTTFASIETEKVESWGKWNVLWEGWSIDAGFSYTTQLDNVAAMIGREFGTLGDYLPLNFPLAKYIKVTLYPIGFIVHDPLGNFESKTGYGLGYIKGEVKF